MLRPFDALFYICKLALNFSQATSLVVNIIAIKYKHVDIEIVATNHK